MVQGTANAGIPTDGLVASYHFNGNANDGVGTAHGTVHDAVLTVDRFGNPDSAYFFDGSGDYIDASADALPAANRTVSLWFRTDTVINRPGLIGYGGGPSGSPGESWFMGLNILGMEGFHMQSHWNTNLINFPYESPPIGCWYHFAITTAPDGTRLYVNGVEELSNGTFVNNTTVVGTDLAIGVIVNQVGVAPYTDGNVGYFQGSIDELLIYNRALSPTEIQQLYGSTPPPECVGACCLGSQPVGSCSLSEQFDCIVTSEGVCADLGGSFVGVGTACEQEVKVVHHTATQWSHEFVSESVCGSDAFARGCVPGPAKIDPWVTSNQSAGSNCEDFSHPDACPLPADFFGPGSDPFNGVMCFTGEPLGVVTIPGFADPLDFGDADTLVRRDVDPFDRCDLPSANEVTVDIKLERLNLVGCVPLIVTFNGGQNPEEWIVRVKVLDSTEQPEGSTLTATKDHCNGGTFRSTLAVCPKFIFTKATAPFTVMELDFCTSCNAGGIVMSTENVAWVADPGANVQLVSPICSDFHPGIEDSTPVVDCDCDANGVRDKCDIEQGTSLDCNTNARPDSCDIDLGLSPDSNLNGIPDECELTAPVAGDDVCVGGPNAGGSCSVDSDCLGGVCGLKSRYITIAPPTLVIAGGDPLSIQVTIESMPQFPSRVGGTWWAGASESIPNPPGAALNGAELLCEAAPSNAQVWPEGPLHLFGTAIVPGSTYEVRMCDSGGINCSDPLVVATGKWGDIISPFGGGSQPNLGDVNAAVLKFQGSPSGPSTPRADLRGIGSTGAPNTPNQVVDLADVNAGVQAFQGFTYPYIVPVCP